MKRFANDRYRCACAADTKVLEKLLGLVGGKSKKMYYMYNTYVLEFSIKIYFYPVHRASLTRVVRVGLPGI